jgi:sulfur-oxidizing protein SoxX
MPGSRPSAPKCSRSTRLRLGLPGLWVLTAGSAAAQLAPYQVIGDGIPASLTSSAGDAAQGQAVFAKRQISTCLLCHADPNAEGPQAAIGPSLRGVGARLTPAQIRLRLVDARRINPETLMPPFYAVTDLQRVAPAWQGQPILTATQIEDLVAFLATLQTS